tara:strand:- start:2650 stop:4050 length:1401 start_codon:yes stop_codon:yes gene_type:complete
MINKLTKLLVLISFVVIVNSSYVSTAYSHDHTPRKQLISKLKKEIENLGEKPVRKGNIFGLEVKYIEKLQAQLDDLKEKKKIKEQIEAAKKAIIEEIKEFGAQPVTKSKSFIDTDEEIIALKKQLDELKLQKEIETTKAAIIKELKELGIKPETKLTEVDTNEEIVKLREQLEQVKAKKAKEEEEKINAAKNELINELEKLGVKPKIDMSGLDDNAEINALKKQIEEVKAQRKKAEDKKKAEQKKIADQKEAKRQKAIENVKKEILFLGETPLPEYEFNTEDKYIAALRNQIEEIRRIKEEEELKLGEAVPDWYVRMPKGSETVMYARGTHASSDLDQSEIVAIEQAKIKLALNLQTRMNAKIQTAAKEAGVDGDLTLKQEFDTVSKSVAKDVSLNGYKIYNTQMAPVPGNKFRTYIVLEFPISFAYKNYLNSIETNAIIKKKLPKLKDTDAFKELEQYVSEFTGA